MKKKLIFIFLIAGLIGAKALFADRTPRDDARKHLKPFVCENPVEGELLVQLRVVPQESNRLLRLNQSNQIEVATFIDNNGQVFEQNAIPQEALQRTFAENKMEVISIEPIQAMFKDGENFGKSPENATGIYQEVTSPITRIIFNRVYTTKKGEKVLGYPSKKVTQAFTKQLKSALAQDARFVIPVCQNVEATSIPPFPWPNDPVFDQFQWGLFNFGVLGGPQYEELDVNYVRAWQKIKPVWDIYSTNGDVLSVIGAGIDDRPGSAQNSDMVDVVSGSYVVPALGGSGNYYDYITETHELEVSGVAVAGNDNGIHITGITRDKIFLSVFDDGISPLTNANLIDALDQASLNSEIVNVSYMMRGDDPAIRAILETIASRGVIAVFGAGNNGEDLNNPTPTYNGGYPCRYNNIPGLNINIICVAGISPNGALSTYAGGGGSNYGLTKVHLAAPGKDVWTTLSGDSSTYVSGTSYSAPFISGLMAMVKWYRPSLSANEIKGIIIDPANRRDSTPAPQSLPVVTGGIPDFFKVLQAAETLVICGDADNSHAAEPTILDALMLARMDAGLMPVRDRIADDVNGDGRVSVMDALRVAQFVVGFPVALSCPGT
ncbi:MAG: hypothetical protein A3F16_05375 [Deltaproteobacteria bacterium RIFCSPHIGHO2_12_FULL_43_9]|nr:MAG: hypothetical protein A3F16_05375 [Deltaproteobacteria bacterium RIFCSPHIGHO2_12_FULL_43_9]